MDQKESYGYDRKSTAGWINPSKLIIVGVDCDEDVHPELYDPERLRTKPDEKLIRNIRDFGVTLPVIIKKFRGEEGTFVVDGRQRVLAARIANHQLNGEREILVPCHVTPGDAVAGFIIGNRFRKTNTVLSDARTALSLANYGKTDAEIASYFGISRSTLTQTWWPLAKDAIPAVQKAVEKDEITATIGADIGKLPAAEQPEALRKALEDGGRGAAAHANAKAARKPRAGGEASPRRLPAAKVKAFVKSLAVTDELLDADIDILNVAYAVMRSLNGEGIKALAPYPVLYERMAKVLGGEA